MVRVSGLAMKAEPETTPSSVNVESNNVFMKNLRILDPIWILLSQSNLSDHRAHIIDIDYKPILKKLFYQKIDLRMISE
jgi:hypothetical protein